MHIVLIWDFLDTMGSKWIIKIGTGVLRELGGRVYRDKINEHTFKDLSKNNQNMSTTKKRRLSLTYKKYPLSQVTLVNIYVAILTNMDG